MAIRYGRRWRLRARAGGLLVSFGLLLCVPAEAAEGETPGTILSIALPVGAAGGAVLERDHRGLVQLGEAYASAMAVVYTLKPLVDRRRPDGGRFSFPSGHSASAFTGAGFVQIRYGWRVGIPAYVLASYVAYSRVDTRRHHTSDVIAGAAIGIGANLAFTRPRKHITLLPIAGSGRGGASLMIAW